MISIVCVYNDEDINEILNNQLHDSYFQLSEYYLQNSDFERYKFYLMKIIVNNPDYLVEVIKTIKENKRASIKKVKDSYSFKLGNIILKPLRIVRKTVQKSRA